LVSAGLVSVAPVLVVVASTPRDEVLDDAVAVLAAASDAHDTVAAALLNFAGQSPIVSRSMGPSPREVALRAIARSNSTIAKAARLSVAHRMARSDPSPSVRDAAVQALSQMCPIEGHAVVIDLLTKLRASESNPQVRESIDDAIDSLRTV
jgi:metal-dependent amidase/aminoacylase/carboxypeptidase family protein